MTTYEDLQRATSNAISACNNPEVDFDTCKELAMDAAAVFLDYVPGVSESMMHGFDLLQDVFRSIDMREKG